MNKDNSVGLFKIYYTLNKNARVNLLNNKPGSSTGSALYTPQEYSTLEFFLTGDTVTYALPH